MIFLMQNGSPIGRINKMDDYILITQLNDFIFCPASIYFHNLYGSMDRILYQGTEQLNGTKAHEKVDTKGWLQRYIFQEFLIIQNGWEENRE